MKFPIMVLSYGEFSESNKKLFFYEDHKEVSILPIFTDLIIASNFQKYASKILKKHKDNRKLEIQICSNKQYAIDMLITITTLNKNIQTIAIDPIPPDKKRKSMAYTKTTIEKMLEELSNTL